MSRVAPEEFKETVDLFVKRLTHLEETCEGLSERFKQAKEFFHVDFDEIDQEKQEEFFRRANLQNAYLVPMIFWMYDNFFQSPMEFTSDEYWSARVDPEKRKMFDFLGTQGEIEKFFVDDMQRL